MVHRFAGSPHLQLPCGNLVTAITRRASIGDISRFSKAKNLVGYAGLGARVHDSGQTHRTGRITKAGRRDIRAAMIEVAHTAARTHPYWQARLARLEPRLGKNKAIVAIARKLLVAVSIPQKCGEVEVPRCRSALAEEPGIVYTGGASSYWSI